MKTRFTAMATAMLTLALPVVAAAQAPVDLGGPTDTYVTIDSEPQGVTFTLEGPNKVSYVTGTTPAAFVNLPTSHVIIHYANVEGCVAPKPQNRVVDQSEPMNFFGRYNCDPIVQAPALVPAEPEDMRGLASIRISPHQVENMPGGEVRYTVAVHNHSKTTQNNLVASLQYDPKIMELGSALPAGGVLAELGVITWPVPQLYAGQTWSVVAPLRIKDSVSQGRRIEVSARVAGDELRFDSTDETTTNIKPFRAVAVVGTPIMPPTGGRFDILFLLLSAFVALSASLVHSRKYSMALERA